jgi:hypothetical protein
MGRKNWKETVSQKGPGRKTRKQKDPELPVQLREKEGGVNKVRAGVVGGRIIQRARKRAVKNELKLKAKAIKSAYSAVPPPQPEPTSPSAVKKPKLFDKIKTDKDSDNGRSL